MLRLIKAAIIMDLIFGEKFGGGFGKRLLQMTLGIAPLVLCSIWTQFGSYTLIRIGGVRRGVEGMACCEPPSSYQHARKKNPRAVINTPWRGGETETLPWRLACCCIRPGFCLKHNDLSYKRRQEKEGLPVNCAVRVMCHWSLVLCSVDTKALRHCR